MRNGEVDLEAGAGGRFRAFIGANPLWSAAAAGSRTRAFFPNGRVFSDRNFRRNAAYLGLWCIRIEDGLGLLFLARLAFLPFAAILALGPVATFLAFRPVLA